ncbi:ESX-1 secretion-associated protein EspI-like [Macrobrachium rosenbergii]|uniref:ESX-1 secretion-associated protein EspI-like n=1 Tax=Macrobrachium rosenbergii TaxID=79674 RepID=UPI0034D3A80E
MEQMKIEHFLLYAPPALTTHVAEKEPTTLVECCHIADSWDTHHPQESSLQRKITPPAFLLGAPPPKNGHSQKPVVCGFCKKIGHSKEKYRSKPPEPFSPGQPTNKLPAPSARALRRDFSQTFCKACKVFGHSPSWAKCPRNNKSGNPAIALAVTNPESLGPPAKGPIYVAPPRVPGTVSVPVSKPQPDLPSGESRLSTPLPVPLGRTEQCQFPSVQTDETTTMSLPAPVPMSVPEHAPDPPSRDPTPNPPSSPSLVLLPVTRETGSPDRSGGSPKGTDSQPGPEHAC